MGVLPCNRGDCANIMCSRYSHKYGYLCNECFDELLNSTVPIAEFMQSYKGPRRERLDVKAEFEER